MIYYVTEFVHTSIAIFKIINETHASWYFVISGTGVTEAPFVNCSVKNISEIVIKAFGTQSYLIRVTTAELRRHLADVEAISKSNGGGGGGGAFIDID